MKKLRVFCASVATETNTFSPLRTDFVDFEGSFYALPGEHPETPTLCSAVFISLRHRQRKGEIELVEGTAAWAEPGGLLNAATWTRLKDEVLIQLQNAGQIDAVILGLHGAMISENCVDCEGELISVIRQVVGPDVIIGATFDPHSHLSQKRVENTDIITVFKEFPHTDFVETGEICVDLCLQAARKEINPHISVFDVRLISVLLTNLNPMRSFIDRITELENVGTVLSISIIHGFMAGDSPDLGAKVMVITNNDKTTGEYLAKKIGMELFSFRGHTTPEYLAPEKAISKAKQLAETSSNPVVVADVWDNPGGGVAGDSTILLNEVLRIGLRDVAIGTIWDPMAVRLCFLAGEGAKFDLQFGGKTSSHSGPSICANVKVKRLVRNAFQNFGPSLVPMGDSACISFNGLEIILNTNRSQTFSPDVFINLGVDPCSKKILIIKSTNHFYDAFVHIASNIIYAAVDGIYPNNPKKNNYKRLKRAIWPIVKNPHQTEFE